jgi:hypothetical protein
MTVVERDNCFNIKQTLTSIAYGAAIVDTAHIEVPQYCQEQI